MHEITPTHFIPKLVTHPKIQSIFWMTSMCQVICYITVCQHEVDGKCVDVCKDHLRSKVRVKKRSRTTEPRCLFRGLFTAASLKGWGQFIYQYSQGCECRSIQSCRSPQTCHQWTAWWWAEGSQRYIIKPASCLVAGTVYCHHPNIWTVFTKTSFKFFFTFKFVLRVHFQTLKSFFFPDHAFLTSIL